MTPLPSFVELMSSLGLEERSLSNTSRTRAHSRTGSVSSLTSSSSQSDDPDSRPPRKAPGGSYYFAPARSEGWSSEGEMDVDMPSVARHSKGRYSPYSTVRVTKRRSVPVLHAVVDSKGSPDRSLSSSPMLSPLVSEHSGPDRLTRRRGQTWNGHRGPATTPISTFVRRRSPHSPSASPISATFPRSILETPLESPVTPLDRLSIPALPTLQPFFPSPPSERTTFTPSNAVQG